MWPLAIMLRPDVVVVTSIGSEHQQSLKTLAVTRAEKARMVEALQPDGLAVINGDDPNVLWMASRASARVIGCGFGPKNAVRAAEISFHYPPRMEFRAEFGAAQSLLQTRLLGYSMVFPMLATWAVAREENVPETDILQRLVRAGPINRRMEPVSLVNGAWGIVDDCKALPETLAVALETLAELPAKRKWIVMGDIGGHPQEILIESAYRSCGGDLARVFDRLLLVTADVRKRDLLTTAAIEAGLSAESITAVEGSLPAAVEYLRGELQPGDVVLIKGRFFERLERVAIALEGRAVRCWIPRCEPRGLNCRQCPQLLGTPR
jgi:UDP-N-acetylmuramoyl-tripeptide--D-alanyl-D-alanine ligase